MPLLDNVRKEAAFFRNTSLKLCTVLIKLDWSESIGQLVISKVSVEGCKEVFTQCLKVHPQLSCGDIQRIKYLSNPA